MDIWLLIVSAFLSSVVIFYFAIYLLGYRFTRKRVRKTPGKPTLSDSHTPTSVDDEPSVSANAIKHALSEVDDGVIIIRGSYQVGYINNAAMNIFGIVPDKWHGLTFIEIVRDHECNELLRKCMDTGQQQAALVRTRQKKQVLGIAVFPGREEDSYVVIVKDLTERQKIEQIRRDLVSNVAHEFRTPIASIRLLAETLQQGALNDPEVSVDFLRKIDVESARLQRMTDDLNQLSVIESDGLTSEKGAVDMERLVKQAVERLRAQADRKGISIILNIEPSMPRPAIDENGIESVLMNLVHNAIKYTDTAGRITINARKDKGAILVSVTDTGIGISADELPRIFERFYKVDRSRNTEGSGLGLAISKHIITSHGGKIWAESTEGKGSTFYFSLPLTS